MAKGNHGHDIHNLSKIVASFFTILPVFLISNFMLFFNCTVLSNIEISSENPKIINTEIEDQMFTVIHPLFICFWISVLYFIKQHAGKIKFGICHTTHHTNVSHFCSNELNPPECNR